VSVRKKRFRGGTAQQAPGPWLRPLDHWERRRLGGQLAVSGSEHNERPRRTSEVRVLRSTATARGMVSRATHGGRTHTRRSLHRKGRTGTWQRLRETSGIFWAPARCPRNKSASRRWHERCRTRRSPRCVAIWMRIGC
jgi:hypothetical protein